MFYLSAKANVALDPGYPIGPAGEFESKLRKEGLTDEEILATYAHYNTLYLGHLNAARTAPNPKLAKIITKNFAQSVVAAPIIGLWWGTVSSSYKNHEVHSDFATAVEAAILDIGKQGENEGA